MQLPLVTDWLKGLPRRMMSSDGKQIRVLCPWCDIGRNTSEPHLSISLDAENKTPLMYHCFRQSCGESGILKTDTLQRLGCTDMNVILELANHNASISKSLDGFKPKKKKKFLLLNINNEINNRKLAYVNSRLGTKLTVPEMKDLKIQLSLYDYLNVNHIKRLAFPEQQCDLLNSCTIGFVSMYEDYVICRDITKTLKTGKRYTMYRSSGIPDPSDTKVYCIPTEIDLIDPEPAIINVAEGTFSILGAYLHTEIGRDRRNCLFLANCGGGYLSTIKHICKQYGFLSVEINIFSDSEVGLKTYEKLYRSLKNDIDIHQLHVYYNDKAEDFGVPIDRIHVKRCTII